MRAAVRRVAPSLVLSALLLACDAGGKSTGPSSSFQVTGTYEGTERIKSPPPTKTATLRVSLTQSGRSVTGSYSNSLGHWGTVTGEVSGTTFSGRMVSNGYVCEFTAQVSNAGRTIEGTFSGKKGSFSLDRV